MWVFLCKDSFFYSYVAPLKKSNKNLASKTILFSRRREKRRKRRRKKSKPDEKLELVLWNLSVFLPSFPPKISLVIHHHHIPPLCCLQFLSLLLIIRILDCVSVLGKEIQTHRPDWHCLFFFILKEEEILNRFVKSSCCEWERNVRCVWWSSHHVENFHTHFVSF